MFGDSQTWRRSLRRLLKLTAYILLPIRLAVCTHSERETDTAVLDVVQRTTRTLNISAVPLSQSAINVNSYWILFNLSLYL